MSTYGSPRPSQPPEIPQPQYDRPSYPQYDQSPPYPESGPPAPAHYPPPGHPPAYGTQPPTPQSPQHGRADPVTRPVLLNIVVIGALVVGVLTIVSSILQLASADDLVNDVMLGDGSVGRIYQEMPQEVRTEMFNEAHRALLTRQISAMVSGALVVLFALLSRRAAIWARVILLILVIGNICGLGLTLFMTDSMITGVYVMDFVLTVLSLAVPVLIFLPPINRYARAARAGRA